MQERKGPDKRQKLQSDEVKVSLFCDVVLFEKTEIARLDKSATYLF